MSVRPETVLLFGAAGIGLLALLFPLLLRHNDPPLRLAWPRLAVAFAAILLLFGLTRLRSYPFSPGGNLGDGLALGGIVALVTLMLSSLWPGAAATAVGCSGGALLGTVLVLLWHRGYPNAALVGFGAGHAVATLLAGAEEEDAEGRLPSSLWVGPVVAALLAGAVLLAIARAEEMRPAERLALDGKVWWIWPAVLLAISLAGQMVALSVFARRPLGYLAAGLVTALLLLLLWLRFPRYAPLMGPLAAGFVTSLFIMLGCSGVQVFRPSGEGRWEPLNTRTPEHLNTLPALLAPALVLLLLATAYRLYTGYGIALAALGAAVQLPWLADREPRAVGRALFGLLAAAVLFRVYYNSYDLRSGDIPLTAHYAMVGLLAGALAPFVLGAFRWGMASGPSSARHGLPVLLLLASVALPCLLTLFWGQKSGGGLLLGLVVGQGYRMMAALLDAGTPGTAATIAARAPEAALLLMGWVTVQLLNQVATYGLQLLRVQRLGLIAALVTLCFLALLYRTWRTPTPRRIAAESE